MNDERGTINDELKADSFYFIVHRSSFRVWLIVVSAGQLFFHTVCDEQYALDGEAERFGVAGGADLDGEERQILLPVAVRFDAPRAKLDLAVFAQQAIGDRRRERPRGEIGRRHDLADFQRAVLLRVGIDVDELAAPVLRLNRNQLEIAVCGQFVFVA